MKNRYSRICDFYVPSQVTSEAFMLLPAFERGKSYWQPLHLFVLPFRGMTTCTISCFPSAIKSKYPRIFVEKVRLELTTPCLQSRCSANWTTTPFDTRVGFEPTNNSFADCSLNRLGNGWMLLRKVKDSNLRYISVCHVSNVVLSVTQPTFLFVAVVEPASHLWVMSPPCDYHTATAILKSLLPFASFRLVY